MPYSIYFLMKLQTEILSIVTSFLFLFSKHDYSQFILFRVVSQAHEVWPLNTPKISK